VKSALNTAQVIENTELAGFFYNFKFQPLAINF
jgi:hypothetical protein